MQCKKCQRPIQDDAVFCPYCGTKQNSTHHRRSNGSGSVYKSGNTWTAEVATVYHDPDGHRHRKTRKKRGFATKREAEDYLVTLREPQRADTGTVMKLWETRCKTRGNLSQNKIRAYNKAFSRWSDIHAKDIDELYLEQLQTILDGLHLSYYASKDMKTVLSQIYEVAIADRRTTTNLAQFLRLPDHDEKEAQPFNQMEVLKFWDAWSEGDPFAGYILLMIYSGMMPEELRNVTKTMIDLKAQTITGAGAKTEKRKDTPIVFPEFICPVIESLVTEDDRLFPYGKEQMYRLYRNCLERIGIDYKPPYSCRHTTATALVEAEASPELIKEVMRHAKLETTQRYIHPSTGATIATIEKLRKPANF